MKKAEFFHLTPRLFDHLQKQIERKDGETFALVATIRADLINTSMRAPKEPVSARDLMPIAPGERKAPVRMTQKRRRAVATTLREVFSKLPGVTFEPGS